MTTATIGIDNPNDDWLIKLYNSTLAPLWAGIKQWFGVALITSGILYMNAVFNMQHDIFPAMFAVAVACGVAWTYLSGLAYVAATDRADWSTHAMIWAGALTDCLFGMLYVLGKYGVITVDPTTRVPLYLATAHVVPLIILVIIFTYCKRLYFRERAENAKRNQERIEKYKDAKLEIEIKRADIAARKEALQLQIAEQRVKSKTCDQCKSSLVGVEYATMKRLGYCKYCDEETKDRIRDARKRTTNSMPSATNDVNN